MKRRGGVRWIAVIAVVMVLLANAVPSLAMDISPETMATGGATEWYEPRGLNIVDLVGAVPDSYLTGSILSYTPGYGIVRYRSGQRSGDTVVITADVYPRYVVDGAWTGTMFGCLGQPARIDQLGSVSPATTVRLYSGATEVTRQATLYSYVPSGLNKPVRNPQQSEWENQYRYWESSLLSSRFTAEGALIMPGNMGCEIIISGKNYSQLTAVYTLNSPVAVNVEVLSTESFTFHSYLGVGYAGLLQPLVSQLSARFSDRHERFQLHIPENADYLWLNFPAMPVDMYTQFPGNPTSNVGRPTGGTYRMNTSQGLSVDHVSSMGLPLRGHWKDMDLANGSIYLPYMEGASMAAPEYFVPAGVEYNPCMIQGNCSTALLDQIYNTSMNMQAVYLRVTRISCGLQQVSLRMVGPSWQPTMVAGIIEGAEQTMNLDMKAMEALAEPEAFSATTAGPFSYFVYLPLVARNLCEVPPDSTCTDGPCGWLTGDGRMVDFVP